MIYLDNNSTAPILNTIVGKISKIFSEPLNASSIHSSGRYARKLLEEARENIAKALGIKLERGEYKIIFTSGGTEANNLIISNFEDGVVLYSPTDHASVIEAAKKLPNSIELKVDKNGILDLQYLKDKLLIVTSSKKLVTAMSANNETGVIQPLEDIIAICREFGALFHTDSVQSFGKVHMNISEMDPDFITISAHKIGGLVGIGALISRDNFHIQASNIGGGQERGERSGTENVIGAVSFGEASIEAYNNLENYIRSVSNLRNYIEEKISSYPDALIIAKDTNRIPNTSLITINGISSDVQLIRFDSEDICVSNGSACSSGKVKASHVLKAMGFEDNIAKSVIRVSFGASNTKKDADKFLEVWDRIYKKVS